MPIKSPLRYPGGKWKALDLILPLIPDNIEDWREPFFGGGSVTLGYIQSPKFTAKRLVVGDLSPEIWAFWQGIKLYPDEVVRIARKWFTEKAPTHSKLIETSTDDKNYAEIEAKALEEAKQLWNWLTTVDTTQLTLPERAARTYLVNRISFSGMGDSGGLSNTQFKHFKLEDTERILQVSPLLQNVEILNASFEVTMDGVDPDKSFIFLDPPYITQEKSGLYGKGGDTHFGFPHQKLADLCRKVKCKWLMTIDDSLKARRLYKGFYIKPFKLKYTLAGKTSEDALAGEEIFVANYNILDSGYDVLEEIL